MDPYRKGASVMPKPRKIRAREERMAGADPNGNRAQRRAAQGAKRIAGPAPTDDQREAIASLFRPAQ